MKINNSVSESIWADRYQKNSETLEQNFHRVAKFCSKNKEEEDVFFEVLSNAEFFFGGRTMSNAGIGETLTLNNCFTSPPIKDSLADIFDKVRLGAITHQKGGGIGYNFSTLRPKGTPTRNDAVASGPLSFMDVFNAQTATILQGNRRGANMGIMSVYHPDIVEFVGAKSTDSLRLNHFNLSVMVDDDFMNSKNEDKVITLHFPVYDENGKTIKDPSKWKITREINARELWDLIMHKSYENGEPGVLQETTMNIDNNLHYCESLTKTNPCSEYLSGDIFGEKYKSKQYGGACNLGSLMLPTFVDNKFKKNAQINYDKLKSTIACAIRMLDNIIDINKFPDIVYENYQKEFRTIGLGINGLADMLVMLNLKYSSKEGQTFVSNLMNFIAKEAYRSSCLLAMEKGAFPGFDKEQFLQSNYIKKHKWKDIEELISQHGIRNAKIMSVAPCGTMSLTFGNNCSSGVEPIFQKVSKRKVKFGGQSEEHAQIVDLEDYAYGLWKKDPGVVKEDVFEEALSIDVDAHIDMLKNVAYHVDMSVSKTINVPTEYTFEQTKDIYDKCWKAGIKGCTIFRPNDLRQGILISSTSDAQIKPDESKVLHRGEWSKLPEDIVYYRRKVYIGCGKLSLFIGYSELDKKIHDIYVIRSGSGGCEKTIQTTVIAMAGMIRLGGDILNIEKAFDGTGGCNSFLSKRIRGEKLSKGSSCGTAMLHEIKAFLSEKNNTVPKKDSTKADHSNTFTADEHAYIAKNGEMNYAKDIGKCPICNDKILHSDGCLQCQCGWSKCN